MIYILCWRKLDPLGYNMLMQPKEGDAKWSYSPENTESQANNEDDKNSKGQKQQSISWTASEFIDNHKGAGWYLLFFIGLLLVSGLIFLFTNDYVSSGAIVFAGIIFVFLAKRKPQQLPYEVNSRGIQIGKKFYQYTEFKSFDLAWDKGVKCLDLIPLKRFMPEITIYFPPEQEEAITNIIASHLPHDETAEKNIDRIIKKLHF